MYPKQVLFCKIKFSMKNFFLRSSGPADENNQKQRNFLENGGTLLKELVSSCKGRCRCNPIRSFSAEEVEEATSYYKTCCHDDPICNWYKGTSEDRPVLIKKYKSNYEIEAYRDIVISSQMSSHKNVLKLLGCCIEFPYPALIYECAENGPLNRTGGIASNGLSLSWKMRLKVAKDIASAITYLHTSFRRPIIHRDIKPLNIFMDKEYVPKLCNFSLSIMIPEGETRVEDIVHGTFGFLDPDYVQTSFVTEHTDVYSFGILLLVFLTGQSALDYNRREQDQHICNYITELIEKDGRNEIVDPKILEGDIGEEQQLQLQAFLDLALKCIQVKSEDRPLMIDVARELVRIEKSIHCSSRLA
ncbi:hypothetical protein TIFTF001_037317 [Ficus carica]|uniref:Protein kinase domain-containing protein n=1 Tax=Ficus carica TaxID=3494 RepID=A0AA88E522_FICCA|nr:hypothetical protein TIFTF001_037317 [Ficus carica]